MFDSLNSLWQGLSENFFMLVPAAFISSVVTYLGTNGEVLLCWIIMSTVDCIFGIAVACTSGTFNTTKLYHWVGKVFVQLLLIFLLAMLFHVVNITLGIEHFVTNWLLLFFILLVNLLFSFSLIIFSLIS